MHNKIVSFDNKSKIFIFLILIGFIVSIFFKLHGLSTNMWDNYLPSQKYKSDNIIFGKEKGIRSDEWLVSTPYIYSQIKHDFPQNNLNIGPANSPLIVHYNVPVKHFISFFKPQNFGFFLLDSERGFSFLWNYKVFGLLISTFLLLMIFTKSNFILSVIGSILVYLSSFVQWWFSIPLPELIIAANMLVIMFAYFINSSSRLKIIIYAFGAIYFFISFALTLYPPFQVVLGYLSLFLMGIILYDYYKQDNIKYTYFKISVTGVLLFLLAILFYIYYLDIKDIVSIIMQTEYPGDRKMSGGALNITHYFSGYYDFFYSETRFPLSYGNVCESSNFIFIFPFFLPFLVVSLFRKSLKVDYKIWILLIYITIVSIWILYGFNASIAHITLFEKVQSSRALLGVGIANIIVTMIFLNWLLKNNIERRYKYEYFVAIFFIFFILGKFMQSSNVFYTDLKIIISSFIFTILFYSIFTKRIKLFGFILLLVSLPSFFINPLVKGLPQFQKKELSEYIIYHNLDKKLWLAFDNLAIPMYLKAIGLDVVNGVNFIPNYERMLVLDSTKKYQNVYNRYAHIVVKPNFDTNSSIRFELKQPDLYEIYINPCDSKIKQLKIKYLIFPYGYKDKIDSLNCKLHLINSTPLNNYNIYEIEN